MINEILTDSLITLIFSFTTPPHPLLRLRFGSCSRGCGFHEKADFFFFLFRCPCFYKCKTLEFQNTIKILSLYRFWFNLFYKLHHSFNSSWQIRSCSHMLSAILKETEHNCLRETPCVSKVWIWKPSIWSCWHLSELYLIEKKNVFNILQLFARWEI